MLCIIAKLNEHFHTLNDLDILTSHSANKTLQAVDNLHHKALNGLNYLDTEVYPCKVPETYINIKGQIFEAGPKIEAYREQNERIQARRHTRESKMSAGDRIVDLFAPACDLGVEMGKTASKVGVEWSKTASEVGVELSKTVWDVGREKSKTAWEICVEKSKPAREIGVEKLKKGWHLGAEWSKRVGKMT